MVREKKYHGVVVPMVTPFTQAGDIDLDAAEKTRRFQKILKDVPDL